MREIKFRAWDRHKKKMGKVTGIIFSDTQHTLVRYQYINDRGRLIDEQSHIDEKGHGVVALLQYTGLIDKNGKEIYEGDIVKTTNEVIATVEWEKEGRFLGFTIENEQKILYINREPQVEVIGNIYENPELLEGQK